MALNRRTRTIGVAAAIAVLTGCQGLVPGIPRAYAPTFRVEALADGPVGQASVPGAAAAPIPVQAQGVTPATAGQLVVSFAHVLPPAAQRRLLATIADVDRVTITLSGNGVNHTETIPKAAIVNGQTTFTFTGLPAGTLTVTIKALNAAGATIGQDVQQATVTAGQTTTVNASVPLTPTVPTPQVIVGGSGGSGGSGGTTGSLTANVTLRDDVPVVSPAVLGVYAPPSVLDELKAYSVTLDNQQNAWFAGDFSHDVGAQVAKVSPAGVLSFVGVGAESWWWIAPSHDGSRILTLPVLPPVDRRYGVSLDGTELSAPSSLSDVEILDEAPDGSLHVLRRVDDANGSLRYELARIAPDGTSTVTYAAPEYGPTISGFQVFAFSCDRAGDVVADGQDFGAAGPTGKNAVRKYKPDGTQVFSLTFNDQLNWVALSVATDSQNNVWVLDGEHRILRKYAPTGTLLGAFSTGARCNKLYIDALDRVWAYPSGRTYLDRTPFISHEATDVISRFSSAGALQAYYSIGQDADTEEIAVSSDDHLWVASKNKGLIHLQLAPLP